MEPEKPLLRLRQDPDLWGKVAALWHRERAREEYVSAGYEGHAARKKANDEALDVARAHGFRGGLGELKAGLGELLAHHPGTPAQRPRGGYWEDGIDRAMLSILRAEPEDLVVGLKDLLLGEVERAGPFSGKVGLYKLAYIVGFVPPLEHLGRRNAFIRGLSEIGHHAECCEPGLFNVVFRLSRTYTLRSFEARRGIPFPVDPPRLRRRVGEPARRESRWMPSWLRSQE